MYMFPEFESRSYKLYILIDFIEITLTLNVKLDCNLVELTAPYHFVYIFWGLIVQVESVTHSIHGTEYFHSPFIFQLIAQIVGATI